MIFTLQDTPQRNSYYLSDDKKFRFKLNNAVFLDYDSSSDFYTYYSDFISFFDSSDLGSGFTCKYNSFSAHSVSDLVVLLEDYCPNFFELYNYPDLVNNSYRISSKTPAPQTFEINNNEYIAVNFFNSFVGNDFSTNLYPELLDNSEQFQMAKSFLNDSDPNKQLDPTYWTDSQLKFFKFVEEYNKNVLALRATKKVSANVSGSISQICNQQDIDLSPITNQLLNLNSKFEITRRDANNQTYTENITKVLDDSIDTKSVVLETIEKAPFNPYLNDDNNDIYGV